MSFKLPIEKHDRVVAAFPWRDKVLVITEGGHVIEILAHEEFGEIARLISR